MVYSVSEVAKLLRVNRNFVYDSIRRGELEAIRIGSIKITKEALERYMKEREVVVYE